MLVSTLRVDCYISADDPFESMASLLVSVSVEEKGPAEPEYADHHFYDLANTVAAAGASPLIRIPADEPWMIKASASVPMRSCVSATFIAQRALDSGAHGIMVPMANTPVRARQKLLTMLIRKNAARKSCAKSCKLPSIRRSASGGTAPCSRCVSPIKNARCTPCYFCR